MRWDLRLPVMHVCTQALGEGGQAVPTEASSWVTFALGQLASQDVISSS